MNKKEAQSYNSLALAYLGDSVLELLTRSYLLKKSNTSAKKLHEAALKFVCAKAQSAALQNILPLLNEEETAVFKRGRNAKPASLPKNQEISDYHAATGFECLFGYLYLCGEEKRLQELFNTAYNI